MYELFSKDLYALSMEWEGEVCVGHLYGPGLEVICITFSHVAFSNRKSHLANV